MPTLAHKWLQVIRNYYTVFGLGCANALPFQALFWDELGQPVDYSSPEIDSSSLLHRVKYHEWDYTNFDKPNLMARLSSLETRNNECLLRGFSSSSTKALGSLYSASLYMHFLVLAWPGLEYGKDTWRDILDKALAEYEALSDGRHYRCHTLFHARRMLAFRARRLEHLSDRIAIICMRVHSDELPELGPESRYLWEFEKIRLILKNPPKYLRRSGHEELQTRVELVKNICRDAVDLICGNQRNCLVGHIVMSDLNRLKYGPLIKQRPLLGDLARGRLEAVPPVLKKRHAAKKRSVAPPPPPSTLPPPPPNFQTFLVDLFGAHPLEAGRLLFKGLRSIEGDKPTVNCC
jgi:hypothetical protein